MYILWPCRPLSLTIPTTHSALHTSTLLVLRLSAVSPYRPSSQMLALLGAIVLLSAFFASVSSLSGKSPLWRSLARCS